jgi:hypothetical protein
MIKTYKFNLPIEISVEGGKCEDCNFEKAYQKLQAKFNKEFRQDLKKAGELTEQCTYVRG